MATDLEKYPEYQAGTPPAVPAKYTAGRLSEPMALLAMALLGPQDSAELTPEELSALPAPRGEHPDALMPPPEVIAEKEDDFLHHAVSPPASPSRI